MSKTDSNGRIRQVAVMLSLVDAATARALLGQLPASQARLVRQQAATLQNVTPAERDAALKMLSQIKRQAALTATAHPKPSPRADYSPAEALLSDTPHYIDRIEFTSNYESSSRQSDGRGDTPDRSSAQSMSNDENGFVSIHAHRDQPYSSTPWTPAWQHWSGEELARLLESERPLLIAAVLLQAPAELGSVILESLPATTATAVLAALPQLHTTDTLVLQEIHAQLHQRLTDFQRQASPENAGMAKLQAILSAVSMETRQRLEASLATADPLLAHSLGVASSMGIGHSRVAIPPAVAVKAHEGRSTDELRMDDPRFQEQRAQPPSNKSSVPAESDVFDTFDSLCTFEFRRPGPGLAECGSEYHFARRQWRFEGDAIKTGRSSGPSRSQTLASSNPTFTDRRKPSQNHGSGENLVVGP